MVLVVVGLSVRCGQLHLKSCRFTSEPTGAKHLALSPIFSHI